MILSIIIFGIIIITMIIMAVFLINGKGSFLIAGYNTMSKKEKEKYDEKAISRFTGWLLIIISFCVLILFAGNYYQIKWLSFCGIGLIFLISIGGAVYMFTGKRFRNKEIPDADEKDPSSSNKKVITAVLAISVLLVIAVSILFYQGMKDPVINISEDKIQIKAMYGLTIDISEIKDITLIEKSMREIGVGIRLNGFGGAGESLKGHFHSENTGKTLLFVQFNSIPTIKIERNGKKDIYISFRNGDTTLEYYNRFSGIK